MKKAFLRDAGRWAVIILTTVLFTFAAQGQTANFSRTLPGHVPRAINHFHLHPLGNFAATNQMDLAVSLPLRNEPALDDLLQQVYDPASPNYHHYLTPGQFTAQFGPTEEDYDAVVSFLKTNGFTITTNANRTLVNASGDTAAIDKTFHVTLRVYQHPTENRTFYAPDSEPAISSGIPISHVTGLDNFVIPRPLLKTARRNGNLSIGKAAYFTGSGTNGQFMGKDFRAAYAPGVVLNGTGQSVALFELDGFYTNDILNYETNAGLPNIPLPSVPVNGGVKHISTDGDGEVSLDIEMAISMATNLNSVIIYQAANNTANVVSLLSRIASDNLARQISASWTFPADNSSYDTYYKQMAVQGQTYFQAAGDDGAYFSGIVQWADDTNITLVGGTTLNTTGPQGAYSSETVWNWFSSLGSTNGGVSGGGVNFNNVPIPAYQLGIGMTNNQGSTTLRNVPDVALTADNVYVYYNKGNFDTTEFFGGTSCAAPLWAGFIALVNQQATNYGLAPVGFINPAVYAIGKSANYAYCFHDITVGNNTNTTVGSKWSATNGYDLCTGWGTPNGQYLINALAPAPQPPFRVTPPAGTNAMGYAGGPFTPNPQVYVLTNTTASPIKWALFNNASWLTASATTGTLAADGTASVTLSMNLSANGLAVATYDAIVTFTNSASVTPNNFLTSLQVNEPLLITPATGFSANAAEGGPFSVTSQTYSLTNAGALSLNWQGTVPSWMSLSSSGGTLAAGQSATVTASLNGSAANLLAGVYNGQASFTDELDGSVQNRQFSLSIGQNLVLNGGFETGDFTGWTLNTNGVGIIVDGPNSSVSGISPHAGNYLASFGQAGSPGYLSQTVPTLSNQSYLLSLWFNSPDVTTLSQAQNDGLSSNTPNEFVVAWNGTILFDQTNIPPISGWTNLQFIVTATGSSTLLQFGGRVDPWYLGLDDVNVWPIPTPNVRSFSSAANNAFSLTWNSLTNVTYVVEGSTNLASTNWFIVNTYTASNSVLTVTNPIGTNPFVFYRILGSP
jgi:subtilase family serine protease